MSEVLGVCGTSLVLPGWLVLSITECTADVALMKVRQFSGSDAGACAYVDA